MVANRFWIWISRNAQQVTAIAAIASTIVATVALLISGYSTRRAIGLQEQSVAPLVFFDTTDESRVLIKNFGAGTAMNVLMIEYTQDGKSPRYWAALSPGESKPEDAVQPRRGILMYSGASGGFFCHYYQSNRPNNALGFMTRLDRFDSPTDCSALKWPFPAN